MFESKTRIGNRLITKLDLVVDFATLGEYGLESPAEASGTDRAAGRCVEEGRRTGWEASATPRRGGQCESGMVSSCAITVIAQS